jgi:hypothetical protein
MDDVTDFTRVIPSRWQQTRKAQSPAAEVGAFLAGIARRHYPFASERTTNVFPTEEDVR